MKKKPLLGYSLALYLSTVMWIVGMVGMFTIMGGDMYHGLKGLHWYQTIDELNLSREEYRLARAEMEEGRRRWKAFYCPIDEFPWLPVPLGLCALIGGAGYRIRKGMGAPVSIAELFR